VILPVAGEVTTASMVFSFLLNGLARADDLSARVWLIGVQVEGLCGLAHGCRSCIRGHSKINYVALGGGVWHKTGPFLK
jgi:hypothetical protein